MTKATLSSLEKAVKCKYDDSLSSMPPPSSPSVRYS